METTTTAIAEYSAVESGLADLRTRYGNVAWDLRTVKGNAEARAARKELVTLRTSLEAKRKEVKESVLERAKLIDGEAKRITAELLKIETPIDAAIKADETRREDERKAKELAEQQRVARIMATIKQMTEIAINSVGKSSEVIGMEIDALEFTPIHVEDYAEYREAAQAAKEATLAQLRKVRDAALASEQEAARLQAEREELARQQAEAKRQAELQAAELAETQRIEREKLAAERVEMERQQAAERDRIAAEQAEAARVLTEKMRIEREAREAEQAKRDAEARAIQAEQDRIEREARALQAQEDAARAERQRVIEAQNARVAAELATEAARIADEKAALTRMTQSAEAQHAPQQVEDGDPDDCPTLGEILESIAGDFNVSINTARRWLVELAPQLTPTVPLSHPVLESLEP